MRSLATRGSILGVLIGLVAGAFLLLGRPPTIGLAQEECVEEFPDQVDCCPIWFETSESSGLAGLLERALELLGEVTAAPILFILELIGDLTVTVEVGDHLDRSEQLSPDADFFYAGTVEDPRRLPLPDEQPEDGVWPGLYYRMIPPDYDPDIAPREAEQRIEAREERLKWEIPLTALTYPGDPDPPDPIWGDTKTLAPLKTGADTIWCYFITTGESEACEDLNEELGSSHEGSEAFYSYSTETTSNPAFPTSSPSYPKSEYKVTKASTRSASIGGCSSGKGAQLAQTGGRTLGKEIHLAQGDYCGLDGCYRGQCPCHEGQDCSTDCSNEIRPACVECPREPEPVLFCHGNNYRCCNTDAIFPAPTVGQPARGGHLGFPASVTYNGSTYAVPAGGVYFCDSNLTCCGPGDGEARTPAPECNDPYASNFERVCTVPPADQIVFTKDEIGERFWDWFMAWLRGVFREEISPIFPWLEEIGHHLGGAPTDQFHDPNEEGVPLAFLPPEQDFPPVLDAPADIGLDLHIHLDWIRNCIGVNERCCERPQPIICPPGQPEATSCCSDCDDPASPTCGDGVCQSPKTAQNCVNRCCIPVFPPVISACRPNSTRCLLGNSIEIPDFDETIPIKPKDHDELLIRYVGSQTESLEIVQDWLRPPGQGSVNPFRDPTYPVSPTDPTSGSLTERINAIANDLCIPPELLMAISETEAPGVWGWSDTQVDYFSNDEWWETADQDTLCEGYCYNTCANTPCASAAPCFPGADVMGPMQFEAGTWREYMSGGLEYRCRLDLSLKAAATKIRRDASSAKCGVPASTCTGWTETQVRCVAKKYCGSCNSSACPHYCDVVWQRYEERVNPP